jgi:hypothetical protein
MGIFTSETRSVWLRAFSGLMLLMLAQLGWSQPVGWSTALPIAVTENSGAPLSGYQLRLQLDTANLVTGGLMNADGSDLRFGTDEQGTTLLQYYLENGINTASTVVWVRLGALPASSSIVIWMFTGNPGAASNSSLLGTFDYVDQLTNSATAQVSGGAAGGVGNSQRGFRFSTSQDILLFQFGKNEPTGSTRYITLFDFNTQAILVQMQVSGPAGQYSYTNLPQPIWLTSGTQYLLEMYQDSADGYYWGAAPSINPPLTYYDMRYCNGCNQNTFPTSSLSGMHYGYSDFEFVTRQQVSPAPTYTLAPGATTTSLVSDIPNASYGQTVTFTATVDGLFNPAGTVSFYDTDGFTLVADCPNPAPLSLVSTQLVATCSTTSLTTGSHSINASYSGDAYDLASAANPFSQQVAKADSTTLLDTACMSTFVDGQPFTMNVVVTGVGATGDVTFLSGGSTELCANVPLVGGSATCTTAALVSPVNVQENYDLTATYAGDANNNASASTILPVTVLQGTDVVFRGSFETVASGCPVE